MVFEITVKGQSRIIWTKLVDLTSQMLFSNIQLKAFMVKERFFLSIYFTTYMYEHGSHLGQWN